MKSQRNNIKTIKKEQKEAAKAQEKLDKVEAKAEAKRLREEEKAKIKAEAKAERELNKRIKKMGGLIGTVNPDDLPRGMMPTTEDTTFLGGVTTCTSTSLSFEEEKPKFRTFDLPMEKK